MWHFCSWCCRYYFVSIIDVVFAAAADVVVDAIGGAAAADAEGAVVRVADAALTMNDHDSKRDCLSETVSSNCSVSIK